MPPPLLHDFEPALLCRRLDHGAYIAVEPAPVDLGVLLRRVVEDVVQPRVVAAAVLEQQYPRVWV